MKRVRQVSQRVVLLAGLSAFVLWSGQSVVEAVVRANEKTERFPASTPADPRPLDPSKKFQIPGSNGYLPLDNDQQSQYKKGELIVKFRDSVSECVHCVFESQRTLASVTLDRSNSLDEFFKKHPLKSVHPLFPQWHEETIRESKTKFQKAIEAAQEMFPHQTASVSNSSKVSDLTHIYLLETDEGTDIPRLCQELRGDSHVEYAQPNYKVEAFMVPNDPYYSSRGSWGQPYDDLWGLKKIQTERAWDISQGEGVVVAVVDTGLDYNHPDIAANVWTNPREIPNNRIDDDQNGYVDDVRGWDFAANDNDPMDGNGHGTHVSGTIAAVGNNGIGVIGVAPRARIMPVKGLSDEGSGSSDDLAQGIVYAAMNGASVMNNSWGCSEGCPSNPVVEDAVRTAYRQGSVVVFAAGNSSSDIANRSPQNMRDPKPIVVSATTPSDLSTPFTNSGIYVDVGAPGGGDGSVVGDPCSMNRNILSLRAQNTSGERSCLWVGEDYLRLAGTSMSAPHVSGVAALLYSQNPNFTNEDIRQIIRSSADDVESPGFDLQTGAGRVNAERALGIGSPLQVKINSPISEATLFPGATPLTITGSATGTDFRQYELYYSVRQSPPIWIPIGGVNRNPVSNGVLGSWSMNGLSTNAYLLKLLALSGNSLPFEDVISVSIERPLSRQITTGVSSYPVISGNRVVWRDGRHRSDPFWWGDVYLYDVSTNTERRITTDSDLPMVPAICGNRIVYQDYRNNPNREGRRSEMYLYDLATNTERRLTTQGWFRSDPAISEDWVVWAEAIENLPYNARIYVYDLRTHTGRTLPTVQMHFAYTNPAISGNRVVWVDSRGSGGEAQGDIYVYDLNTNTERRITTDPSKTRLSPTISGDQVIWWEYVGQKYHLYRYDLRNGMLGQITDDRAEAPNLSNLLVGISGNWVVWPDMRNGNSDIFLYDLQTHKEHQLTSHLMDQGHPAISGDRIVWLDGRDGSIVFGIGNIYLWQAEENQLPLSQGDNAITLTHQLNGEMASYSFLQQSPSEVIRVARFNEIVQQWESAIKSGNEIIGLNFPLEVGKGYIIQTTGSATITYRGLPVEQPLPINLTRGENLIGIPYPIGQYTSSSLRSAIPGCERVARYNRDTRQWEEGEFPILPNEGYMVRVARDVRWLAGGRPPVLSRLNTSSLVREGQALRVRVSAVDPDRNDLTLETNPFPFPPLPEGARFEIIQSQPGQISGSFSWTPNDTQSGEYPVTFTVSDGEVNDSETVTMTVQDSSPPPTPGESFEDGYGVWTPDHDDRAPEYQTYITEDQAYDGTHSVALYIDGRHDDGTSWLEREIAVEPNTTATVNLSFWLWSPSASDVNQWFVVAYAEKQNPSTEGEFQRIGYTDEAEGWKQYTYQTTVETGDSNTLWVGVGISCVYETERTYYIDLVSASVDAGEPPPANRPPSLSPIKDQEGREGERLEFLVTASDKDGDEMSLQATGLPRGASFVVRFSAPGVVEGQFLWEPDYTQAGPYEVTFSASDGRETVERRMTITVINNPITFTRPLVAGWNLVSFPGELVNPDAEALVRSIAGIFPPIWRWNPSIGNRGGYERATTLRPGEGYWIAMLQEGELRVDLLDPITQYSLAVSAGRYYMIGSVYGVAWQESQGAVRQVWGLERLSSAPWYQYREVNRIESGKGYWALAERNGVMRVGTDITSPPSQTSRVLKGEGNPPSLNLAPVVSSFGNKETKAGEVLTFRVMAESPRGGLPILKASSLPPGARFNLLKAREAGKIEGQFLWKPNDRQIGQYQVTFTASDGVLSATETVVIRIIRVNRPPVASYCVVRPSITQQGNPVDLYGNGRDTDGRITDYRWSSDRDGELTRSRTGTIRNLSVGTHTISFKVQDNEGMWSEEVTRNVTVRPRRR